MKKRDSFTNRLGFILACVGSAVGMGNLWMFPTRVSLYGGGSFLIPYFIFVVLIGATGVIGEMAFGRAARSGPVNAFGMALESRGKRKLGEALGLIPMVGALAMAIGYTVVMGWILKYAVGTFTGATLAPADVDSYAAAFGGMASAFGNNGWQIAALVIIPAMATTGSQLDQGGPGLMFIFLPNLFHSMPGGSLFAIIFFVAVLFAGMTSLLNLYETPIATLQEKFNFARVPACLTIGIIGIVVSICIQGIVSGWMDVLSIYICPLGAGLAAIMFFWFCKREFVEAEVNKGRDKPLFPWFYPLCKYVLCPVCVLVLILGTLNGGIG